MARKTSLRQEMFAREYVIDLNGRRAAIAAGYSEKGADVRASNLLNISRVRKLIDNLNAKRASKLEITAEKLDEKTASIAFANMGDYVQSDADGQPKSIDLSQLTREQWAAVQEIREDTTGGVGDGERRRILRTTLKLADTLKALELLYRRQGLLQDKVKMEVTEALGEKVALFRQRKMAP